MMRPFPLPRLGTNMTRHIQKITATLLMVSLAVAFSSGAHADTGKIRICRYPGITSRGNHKNVTIAADSLFTESSDKNGDGGGGYEVKITADATMGPAPP
jgi:hypothetical protein